MLVLRKRVMMICSLLPLVFLVDRLFASVQGNLFDSTSGKRDNGFKDPAPTATIHKGLRKRR